MDSHHITNNRIFMKRLSVLDEKFVMLFGESDLPHSPEKLLEQIDREIGSLMSEYNISKEIPTDCMIYLSRIFGLQRRIENDI